MPVIEDFGIQITVADIGRLIRDKSTPVDLKNHYKSTLKRCNDRCKETEGIYFARHLFFIHPQTEKIQVWID
jgi:hypothetical protein